MTGATAVIESDAASSSWLNLHEWHYDRFFDPRALDRMHPVVELVEARVAETHLDEHSFFDLAQSSRAALDLWVAQELVMTNAFSQLVLYAASRVHNVHARAILAEIAYGEHGKAKKGLAKRAHPWLLERLRVSIGLDRKEVRPAKAAIGFIGRLARHLDDPLMASAFIGVGNERLIDPEYRAIEKCFKKLLPDTEFAPFLDANLIEDVGHSKLCYELASILITSDEDAQKYLNASEGSIQSRVQYFNELLAMAKVGMPEQAP